MNDVYFEMLTFFYTMKRSSMFRNMHKRFFTEPTIRKVFDTVKDFVGKYDVEPTAEQVLQLMKMNGEYVDGDDHDITELWARRSDLSKVADEWLDTQTSAWAKWRAFYTSLENTISYVSGLPKNIDLTQSSLYINKASELFNTGASYNVSTTNGHDFADLNTHIINKEDTHTTGYKFFDLCLNGGFSKKGLYVVMGAPKVGKSMWLCNLCANSVKMGFNTVYITLEMSYQLVSQRIGSNLLDIDIMEYNEVSKDTNKMREKMLNFYNPVVGKTPGRFIIEEFPTSTATATDIEAFVLKKEEEFSHATGQPFKFQNICIDYINIMKDQKSLASSENSYQKIKNICEDVRAMAQRNQWAVISLTQTNRSGQDATDLNMTNVSESSGLVATVDALFGIIQNNVMKANNVYYIKAIALRNSPHMGDKKQYNFDPKHLRLTEDPASDIIPDTIELPKAYTSATPQNQGHVAPQTAPQSYGSPQPNLNANLSLSESQLTSPTANDLFSI